MSHLVLIRVLGGLSASVDGTPIALPADARARELLAWLAVHPGPHARSRLAGLLRPDVAEESARKTLPAEPLIATRESVELRADVDLAAFRSRLAMEGLESAAPLRGGELLAGLDADWALRARDEHAAEVADVLAERAERAEVAGDLTAALDWTRCRIEHEPLAEAAHRDMPEVTRGARERRLSQAILA